MGTKRNPGEYDCYAAALPDEPIAHLLARDPDAPDTLRHWAQRRQNAISQGLQPASDQARVDGMRQIAWDMTQWRLNNNGIWRQPALFFAMPVDVGRPLAEVPREVYRRENCSAVRQSDEMYCRGCGLRWGCDDAEPPDCRREVERF